MAGGREEGQLPDAPGWYPDPWSATGEGERYFDGRHWGTTEKPLARHTSVAVDETRPGRAGRAASPHGWRRILRPGTVVVVFLLAVAAVAIYEQRGSDDSTDTTVPTPDLTQGGSADRPPPSKEESPDRLGTPAAVPEGTGQYEVLKFQRDDPTVPVAFDPCRPIHYVMNPAGAPEDGLALVQSAISKVSAATGLQFVYDGATIETPSKDRDPYLPELYSKDRWAPVLINWADETSYPTLAGYITGVGTSLAIEAKGGRLVYVTGEIVLDAQQLAPSAFPDRDDVEAVVLHELGHVVGLDHTADRDQIMFSESQFNVRELGDGDRRGLALLGTQACFPDV